MSTLDSRYRQVMDRIASACHKIGRDPGAVTLVAVSKTFPVERVQALHALGHVDFGENKAQELVSKCAVLPGLVSGGSLRWHAIGHLQRNKAKDIVATADVFHALDSVRLADELDRRCMAAGRRLTCLVQVNISSEATKSGVGAGEVHAFLDYCGTLGHLEVRGLMTLASPADDPESVRPEFRAMRLLLDTYRTRGANTDVSWLSMGMSGDYEVAIEEGATHVRVGSAIFGERP